MRPQRAAQANLSNDGRRDAVTLRITLKVKNALFPLAVASIPLHGSQLQFRPKVQTAFSTAPWAPDHLCSELVADSQMVLVRNPNYWLCRGRT